MSSFTIDTSENTFHYCIGFLDAADLSRSSKVSQKWKKLIEVPHVWRDLTSRMGIPFVVSLDGHKRNYKEDLTVLFPITTSGYKIAQMLGHPLGKTASISERWIHMLEKQDPFDPNKRMKDTFRIVCTYRFVERTFDGKTPLTLDENGSLVVHKMESSHKFLEGPIVIPLSLKNQRILSLYALNGTKNPPVFDMEKTDPIFDQYDVCIAKKNGAYLMREEVAKETKEKSFEKQLSIVQALGITVGAPEFGVTPLEKRNLFNTIAILGKGTCPDTRLPWSYARSSNEIIVNNRTVRPLSGGFTRKSGLRIDMKPIVNVIVAGIGVVPGCQVEIFSPSTPVL